jgi:hypothetical protein
MSNVEKITKGPEKQLDQAELESVRGERQEALRDTLEKAEQHHKNRNQESLESVRSDAVDKAVSTKEKQTAVERSPAEKRGTLLSRQHREASFKRQMDSIQPHLSKSEQKVSRLIHNKAVEKTSDALGSTLARPNALFAGSVAAFLLVTLVYLLAKYYGYPLSGFETIAAFLIGWALGLIYDYVQLLVRGKRQ